MRAQDRRVGLLPFRTYPNPSQVREASASTANAARAHASRLAGKAMMAGAAMVAIAESKAPAPI
jgi:hypothetical protein